MHIARNIRSVLLAVCLLHASFANSASHSANQGTPFKAILQANHENGDRLANAQISAANQGRSLPFATKGKERPHFTTIFFVTILFNGKNCAKFVHNRAEYQ